MSVAVSDLDAWWDGLRATSLVGTARRQVPRLPDIGVSPRVGASREEALLEAAALGDAVRRAGAVAERSAVRDDPAPTETRTVAPSPAMQILDLLLTQEPVAAGARDLLTRHWLDTAAAADRVVAPRLLPALLELGTTRPAVRRAVAAAAGERAAWLAARNPRVALAGGGRGPSGLPVRDPRALIERDLGDRRRAGPRRCGRCPGR